jgi:hypothetical protein
MNRNPGAERWVVIDFEGIGSVDATAVEALGELIDKLHETAIFVSPRPTNSSWTASPTADTKNPASTSAPHAAAPPTPRNNPMTTTTYNTHVVHVPASPLGLIGSRWKIEHYCTACRQQVATPDLITHTQDHTAANNDDNGDNA